MFAIYKAGEDELYGVLYDNWEVEVHKDGIPEGIGEPIPVLYPASMPDGSVGTAVMEIDPDSDAYPAAVDELLTRNGFYMIPFTSDNKGNANVAPDTGNTTPASVPPNTSNLIPLNKPKPS